MATSDACCRGACGSGEGYDIPLVDPIVVAEELWDELWDAVAGIRDTAPRDPQDVPTDEILEAMLDVLGRRGCYLL